MRLKTITAEQIMIKINTPITLSFFIFDAFSLFKQIAPILSDVIHLLDQMVENLIRWIPRLKMCAIPANCDS